MASESVRQIQQALLDKGFDPGGIDGIWGRRTIAAVMRLQAAKGLKVDGVVGPKTNAVLFGTASSVTSSGGPVTSAPGMPGASVPSVSFLPWLEEAKHLVGTKELQGKSDNPIILDWANDLDIKYQGDDVPWCGLFVAHCIGSTLPQEPLPGNPLGARQWARFGDPTQPREGAVMVFWRGSREGGKGHVGFYVGEDDAAYQILGGNQANSVCLTWISKGRLLQARWPNTGNTLASAPIAKIRSQGLSTNEA
jgi:uncharacterized protein (TIGR02594 family)